MEVMPEDFIRQDQAEVDSTTDVEDSPVKVKKPKIAKKSVSQKKSDKQSTVVARIQAAKQRAAEIFKSTPKTLDDSSESEDELTQLRRQVRDLERKVQRGSSPSQVESYSKQQQPMTSSI